MKDQDYKLSHGLGFLCGYTGRGERSKNSDRVHTVTQRAREDEGNSTNGDYDVTIIAP